MKTADETARNKLGKHPKCPDCKGSLDDSIIVPFYLTCDKCECYWDPTLTVKSPLKTVYGK